jgi:hypothetical protein
MAFSVFKAPEAPLSYVLKTESRWQVELHTFASLYSFLWRFKRFALVYLQL